MLNFCLNHSLIRWVLNRAPPKPTDVLTRCKYVLLAESRLVELEGKQASQAQELERVTSLRDSAVDNATKLEGELEAATSQVCVWGRRCFAPRTERRCSLRRWWKGLRCVEKRIS